MGDTNPALFEDVVQIAAAVCAAPVALISFLEPHRLHLGASSVPVPRDLPREFGFCARTLASPDLLVIPDTHEDALAAGNPALGPPWFARFYAGVPFATSDTRPTGALEIYDHVPRRLEAWQVESLRRLARIIGGTIAAWSAQRERETRRARTVAALAGGLAAELKRSGSAGAATTQAADLARQLLAIAGHRSLRPQRVDLNALVAALSDARDPAAAPSGWSVALDPAAGEVYGDEERIGRAIRGLMAQAAAPGTGPVPIATRDVVVSAPGFEGSLLPPGRYVMVTIGAAAAAGEPLDAWFEAAQEAATGETPAGLAEVSGLMVESGGRLGFRRDPAGGPAFCLALPRIAGTS